MSTKTTPGPFDALEKAQPGEPMFPLLGRDPAAPATITEWCRLRRNAALKKWGDKSDEQSKALLKAEMEQINQAEAVALEMAEYRKGESPEPGVNATYQDLQKTEKELAEADRRKRRQQACRHIREAQYNLEEARSILFDMGLIYARSAADFIGMRDLADSYASHFEERRPQFDQEPRLPVKE